MYFPSLIFLFSKPGVSRIEEKGILQYIVFALFSEVVALLQPIFVSFVAISAHLMLLFQGHVACRHFTLHLYRQGNCLFLLANS